MGYVAVKGGTEAIEASIRRLTWERYKHGVVLDVGRIRAGFRGLIDQVMSEASLYDEDIAALCIKQAEGNPEEAVFTLRAFRSTLPRRHYSFTVDSESMMIERRISATFKEIPGGQILGASYDYVHRLVDFDLVDETDQTALDWMSRWSASSGAVGSETVSMAGYPAENGADKGDLRERSDGDDLPIGRLPKVLDYLRQEGLMRQVIQDDTPPKDITKESLTFPASRSERLQILTRGQTGTVTSLGYASLRGYGPLLHPTVAELRVGKIPITVPNPLADHGSRSRDLVAEDDGYYIGAIRVTEVESVVPVSVPRGQGRSDIEFDLGYGICYGQNETKAIAMSLLDQCLENADSGHPSYDEEFVLLHIDSVEATGFISHLKLPHYVTFQSELDAVRRTRMNAQSSLSDRDVSVPSRGGPA